MALRRPARNRALCDHRVRRWHFHSLAACRTFAYLPGKIVGHFQAFSTCWAVETNHALTFSSIHIQRFPVFRTTNIVFDTDIAATVNKGMGAPPHLIPLRSRNDCHIKNAYWRFQSVSCLIRSEPSLAHKKIVAQLDASANR